jgi:nucleoside-diphosphate kinase
MKEPYKERTLAIIKPDAVAMRDLIAKRYTADKGLKIVGERMSIMVRSQACICCHSYRQEPFFDQLILTFTAGASYVMLLEGVDAIARVNALNGDVDPRKALPGTIRHDFPGLYGRFATVHSSEHRLAAQREITELFHVPLFVVPHTNVVCDTRS